MATVVITGANRGIGLELARQYTARGDDVYAVCRKPGDELKSLDVEIIDGVDLTADKGIETLKKALSGVTIDILFNNAGILTRESFDDLDIERIRRQFEVNTLGPLRVTHALADNLKKGSKVAIVSSRVGSITDNGSGGNYGYRMSKAAVNMAGVNLSYDLHGKGVGVFLLHPGYVITDMTDHQGHKRADVAAEQLIAQLDDLGLDDTGTFWHAEGEPLPW